MGAEIVQFLPFIIGGGVLIGLAGVVGWVQTTKLKINAGYPLEGMWGQSLHPKRDAQNDHRVALLTQENAALQAELGSVKDRLETLERIATDQPARLAREIDGLAVDKGGHA